MFKHVIFSFTTKDFRHRDGDVDVFTAAGPIRQASEARVFFQVLFA